MSKNILGPPHTSTIPPGGEITLILGETTLIIRHLMDGSVEIQMSGEVVGVVEKGEGDNGH